LCRQEMREWRQEMRLLGRRFKRETRKKGWRGGATREEGFLSPDRNLWVELRCAWVHALSFKVWVHACMTSVIHLARATPPYHV